MKKLTSIIISFSILISIMIFGCAHTHKMDLASDPSKFDEINTSLENQKAKITLANVDEFSGKSPQIARDSTFWYDPSTYHRHSVSSLEVEKIVILKRGRGALEGALVGALIGSTAGLILGIVSGDPFVPPEDGGGWGGPNWGASTYIVWFGTSAGLIGLPIGAIVGSKDKYVFAPVDAYAYWREGPHLGFSKYTPFLGLEIQKAHFGYCIGLPVNIGFKYYPNKKGYGWFFVINTVGYHINAEETKNGDKCDKKDILSLGLGAGHKWRFKKHWDLNISLSINYEREELSGDETYRDQYISVWPTITFGYTF